MSVLISPDSVYGKEAWKWEHHIGETHPSDPTIHGMRPREFQAYPAMLYRATQKNPWKFDSHLAESPEDQRIMEDQGFHAGGRGVAAEAFERREVEIAKLAANRNWNDRNISEAARAEVNAHEEASSKHLPEIPVTPIKKRGRPAKVQDSGTKTTI